MRRRIIFSILAAANLVGCNQSNDSSPAAEAQTSANTSAADKEETSAQNPMNKCFEEGVAYYKAIESYPTLSTGKSADDLIIEKCGFNPEMFKDMPL